MGRWNLALHLQLHVREAVIRILDSIKPYALDRDPLKVLHRDVEEWQEARGWCDDDYETLRCRQRCANMLVTIINLC